MKLRNAVFSLVITCLAVVAPSPPNLVAADDAASIKDAILAEKCSLCHSSKRIMMMDPDQLRPVLERMQKMNPDWITNIDREHIAKVLAGVLRTSNVMAIREAWNDAVERGEKHFSDPSMGSNGKACTDCHARETMKQVADGYPQYDLKIRRIVSFEERVRRMITDQLAGETAGAGDPKVLELIAYLKSLI